MCGIPGFALESKSYTASSRSVSTSLVDVILSTQTRLLGHEVLVKTVAIETG